MSHADLVKTVLRHTLRNYLDWYIERTLGSLSQEALMKTDPMKTWEIAEKEIPRILRDLADKVESNQ